MRRLAALTLAAFMTFLSVLTLGIDALSAGRGIPRCQGQCIAHRRGGALAGHHDGREILLFQLEMGADEIRA